MEPTHNLLQNKHRLRKAGFILLGIILSLGVLKFVTSRKSGPYYQGKDISFWFEQLHTNQSEITAQTAFVEMGSNAVPYVLDQLKRRPTVAEKSYEWIHARCPIAISQHLPQPPRTQLVQSTALNALSFVGSEGISAASTLLNMMREGDLSAIYGLGFLGPAASGEVRNSLRDGLKSLNSEYRRACLSSLAGTCIDSNEDVPDLIVGTQDESPGIRHAAVMALLNKACHGDPGQIEPSIPFLIKTLSDSDHDVRKAALWTFMWLRCPRISSNAIPSLLDLFSDKGTNQIPVDKEDVLRALLEVGAAPTDGIPYLIDRITSNSSRVSWPVCQPAWLLARIDPENELAARFLLARFHEAKTEDELTDVISCLGVLKSRGSAAIPRLQKLRNHSAPYVRLCAALAIYEIEGERVFPTEALISYLKTEGGVWNIHYTFDYLGRRAAPAIPQLEALTNSSSRSIRLAAEISLKKIRIRMSDPCSSNKD